MIGLMFAICRTQQEQPQDAKLSLALTRRHALESLELPMGQELVCCLLSMCVPTARTLRGYLHTARCRVTSC